LLFHAIQATLASQVSEAILVVGHEGDRVAAAVRSEWPDLRIVYNPDWAEGQSTSVHTGLRGLSPGIGAALFVLADQPRLSVEVINAVLQGRRETLAPIVAPTYGGQRGNPALFDRDLFPELLKTTGDVGGRGLIQAYAQQVAWAAFGAEAAPGDVDRPEDLQP
jgi:molybdenum cofactor cytidylyltransferase